MATTTSGPLYCHKCGSTAVTVSDKTQMLTVNGRERLHAGVRCGNASCRHEWWSRARLALELSRVADAAAGGAVVA